MKDRVAPMNLPAKYLRRLPLVCLLAFPASDVAWSAESAVVFNRDIRPILSNNCYQCHGPDENKRKSGLRLDLAAGATAAAESGEIPVVPGNPDRSELIRRVTADDQDERMPPAESGKRLSEREIQLLTQWVRQGGTYARHWSYQPPVRPELPEVQDPRWPQNEIDYFILARLEREGMAPAPEADRYALIRRTSLDLTGLPPTIDEVDRFAADQDAAAYEKMIDRLLQQETYGEHWARLWLDLARYADSAGYADDPPRVIWPYRDWVIRAINRNLPFDQFTIEQLAGDLLPQPTDEQRVATGFHRNTQTNNEGGTNDEEYRNVAVVDRVNTTMAVWMGTTMACAQCHSHKFDPITQEDYFRMFAIFNNTEDADRRDESPLVKIEGVPTPVLRELPAERRRKTHLQRRGNFLDTGKEVSPGLPAVFHPPPEGEVDRLALAGWLVDPDNPLTARVVANRYWEAVFGVGLVRTSEEFGTQGELPSHPELLDWLASELVRLQWDTKALVRLLVTSATYRQSARVTPELIARDPDNRLLTRGPRLRLSAEMVRDQALFAGGLLSGKMYGPPVKPPQPAFGVKAAFGGGIDWKTSSGEDRYRRGIYTTWRRSNPYPSMVVFDAPNREVCTVRRDPTNTPLQALVTLNDPVFVEAAQALGRRMSAGGESVADSARLGFRLCLAREPSPQEGELLIHLFEEARRRFSDAPDNAMKMATVPLGPLPEGADVVDLAAWTVVGNVLLNLDEVLMKR